MINLLCIFIYYNYLQKSKIQRRGEEYLESEKENF